MLRSERGLTQERLAELAGVHINSVSLLERGLREPSLYLVFQLAAGLGMAPDAFVRAVMNRRPRMRARAE